ncbi:MAG: RsmG family class I SAM-dependent methyltransferase [bacterium]|nr:RsmG family class I SAM-dependent methyltransferase [bacterium]
MSWEEISPGESTPLESLPLNVSRETKLKIEKFIDLVFTWNVRTNLTGAKSPQDFCHHLLDCQDALQVIPPFTSCLDIGSGSGLPGILWALLLPEAKFFLVESQKKKASFLLRAISQINLQNVDVLSKRFEEIKDDDLNLGTDSPIIVSRGTAAPKNLWKLILSSPIPFRHWFVFSTEALHQEFLTLGKNSDMEISFLQYKKEDLEEKNTLGILTRISPK